MIVVAKAHSRHLTRFNFKINFTKMIIVISLGIGVIAAFITGACVDPSYSFRIAFGVHLPNLFYTLAVISGICAILSAIPLILAACKRRKRTKDLNLLGTEMNCLAGVVAFFDPNDPDELYAHLIEN